MWKEIVRYGPTVEQYWAQWNSVKVQDIVKKKEEIKTRMQLVIPNNKSPASIGTTDGPSERYLGLKIRERFYWLNRKKDIRKLCR